jgi:Homeodomain-like domain
LINEGKRMPAKRELTMRQIRQMLRLARDGVSAWEIGRTLGVARSTIQDNLKRAAMAAAGTALIPITCPVRIGVTPSGLPIDSGAGGDRSGPTPRGSSSPSWPIGLIPNRDFRTCLGVLRLFKVCFGVQGRRLTPLAAPCAPPLERLANFARHARHLK